MAKNLGQIEEKIHRAEVVTHGEQITLPDSMEIDQAIKILQERKAMLDQSIKIAESFDVFPWDGALALEAVLKARFGWTSIQGHDGWFGPMPPQFIEVDVGPDEKRGVMWGQFMVPGTGKRGGGAEAVMACSAHKNGRRLGFKVDCQLLRKHEGLVRDILADLRLYLANNSIYRGKAIKIRLTDDDGDDLEIPEITFMDVRGVKREQLILPADIEASVETNLYTPIARVAELKANGMTVKRGTLLGGTFGTGKTLAATVAAKIAVDTGVTFIYISKGTELVRAVEFAKQYQQPAAVIFCEDIDRETEGERDANLDSLLNIIDGIDTKSSNIMVVMTTNNLEGIHKGMIRPGRLDAVIEIRPPDAEAVERLIRFYGGSLIGKGVALNRVGVVLEGCIPAVIAEVVKRAKLSELRLTPVGEKVKSLSEDALMDAASTMRRQIELLNRDDTPKATPDFSELVAAGVLHALNGGGGSDRIAQAVREKF